MSERLSIKVLSLNLHKGFSSFGKAFVLHEVRKYMRELSVDLVCLQEVIGEHQRHAENHKNWPTESQYEFLADQVWTSHAYGKNAAYSDGHHGNAILSKFPIQSWENFDISSHPLENRGLLYASIKTQDGVIHCLNTHFGLTRKFRKKQFKSLRDYIKERLPKSEPLLLAGDFNDWHNDAPHDLLEKTNLESVFDYAPKTFPSWFPILRLDRIYTQGFKVKSAVCLRGKPWSLLSDHLPLLTHVEISQMETLK